jgi:hypothetical protein
VWVRLDSGGALKLDEVGVVRPEDADERRLAEGLDAVSEAWGRNHLSDREASVLTYFEYSKLEGHEDL